MNGSPASGESKDTNIELAKAYIRYMTFKEDADFWAFEDMDDMTRQDPPRAWQMMHILKQTSHPFSSIWPPVRFNSAGCSLNSATHSHESGRLTTVVS